MDKVTRSQFYQWFLDNKKTLALPYKAQIIETLHDMKIETRQPYTVQSAEYTYFFSSDDLAESASKAEQRCIERGQKLVSFASKEEYAFIKPHLDNGADHYWIGLQSTKA